MCRFSTRKERKVFCVQRKGKVNEDTSHVDIPLKDTDTQRSVA